MNPLSIAILIFVVLESLNVLLLYFSPGSRRGNAVGVFDAFAASRADPAVAALVDYLINWVAGTKLIFVALLVVVLATGSATARMWTVIALVGSIVTFYWRLYSAIRRMDAAGQITPKGYSRSLGLMIAMFLAGFVLALGLTMALRHGA